MTGFRVVVLEADEAADLRETVETWRDEDQIVIRHTWEEFPRTRHAVICIPVSHAGAVADAIRNAVEAAR